MLETLTLDAFRPHVGQPFAILVGEDRFMPAHLVAVQPLSNDGDTRRQRTPFSVLFRGPAGGHLPQDLYRVQSEAMETMELFLVPLGPDADGMLYEAIFT
ncbi:MAG TPA: hypothetical protein VFE05_10895 [Longimicrobiaceae bacterium]|jgi:hypothetical protein|nr:hypothetical protein [Longimicrobiaceae bacterium]